MLRVQPPEDFPFPFALFFGLLFAVAPFACWADMVVISVLHEHDEKDASGISSDLTELRFRDPKFRSICLEIGIHCNDSKSRIPDQSNTTQQF